MSKSNSVMSRLFMCKVNPPLHLLVTSALVCSSFNTAAGSYFLPAKLKFRDLSNISVKLKCRFAFRYYKFDIFEQISVGGFFVKFVLSHKFGQWCF